MYIALGIMLAGVVVGRIGIGLASRMPLKKLTMGSIFLLLFLLGVAIGSNDALFDSLPVLGWQSLTIMLFCVGGSIICSRLITPFLIQKKSQSAKHAR